MEVKEDAKKLSTERVQTSLLSRPEKAVLQWLARRLPAWVGPDALTLLGLLGMMWVGVAYYLAGDRPTVFLIGASVGLAVNWLGDSLDGTLARVRHRQRPKYGYYVDHLVDAYGTAAMILGLAYSRLATPPLMVALLALYMILTINTYLATQTVGVFKISFARLSPTEGRVFLILVNTLLIFVPRVTVFGRNVFVLDLLAVAVSVFLFVVTLRSAYVNLRQLDRAERAAWSAADPTAGTPSAAARATAAK